MKPPLNKDTTRCAYGQDDHQAQSSPSGHQN